MDDAERKKAIELLREMREVGGECSENQGNEKRLTWMYKGPNELVDKEEYLLGKAIDKSFETVKNGDSSDIIGRSYEPSNVPKRLLSKPESTEQVDIEKKILEDPLYAIKQKEMEARRKLLDNPVKLKELQKIIMERNRQKLERKRQKKKQKKKDAMNDEKHLDKLILKKLKILSEGQRKKLLEEAAEISDSSDSDRKKSKKSKRRNRSDSEQSSKSGSESEHSDGSDDVRRKKKMRGKPFNSSREERQVVTNRARETIQRNKRNHKGDKKQQRSVVKRRHKERSQTREKNNRRKSRSSCSSSQSNSMSSSSSSSSSSDESSSSSHSISSQDKKKSKKSKIDHEKDKGRSSTQTRKFANRSRKENDRDGKKGHYFTHDSSSSEERVRMYKRGRQEYIHKDTNSRDRHHQDGQNTRLDRHYREKPQTSLSQSRQISEKERAAKLKEMMENAKVRKVEREQNLANHRKIQSEEEKLKDYDDGFMRRQISHATSQGTMADRIRSNVNNIQRSKADMDRSFMKK